MEALIVGAIIIGIFIYNGTIDKKKFIVECTLWGSAHLFITNEKHTKT